LTRSATAGESRLQPDSPNTLSAQLDHVVDIGCQDHHRRG
jgi:hypothetical protein